jgi:hypothetical protein
VVTILLVFQTVRKQGLQDTIDFRGEKFKLGKGFSSSEVFQNDPDYLNRTDLTKIERLILDARVRRSFASRQELIKATSDLKFPGYGYGCLQFPQADGTVYYVVSVEIPQRNKERHLVVRTTTNGLQMIDDFVLQGHSGLIRDVKEERNRVRYFNLQGTLLRETQL